MSYKKLEAYVEKRLPPAEIGAIQDHLKACPKCRQESADLTLFRSRIRAPHIRLVTRGRLLGGGIVLVAVIVVRGLILLSARHAEIPPEYAQMVERAVSENFIPVPSEVANLGGAPNQRPTDSAPFYLKAPLSTAVLDTKPEFSWSPLPEKAKYSVSIFDDSQNRIDHSGPIGGTSWRPTVRLSEGTNYEWQVRAETLSVAYVAHGAQGRRARFRVLSKQEAESLARIAQQASENNLLLGILYTKAGAFDEADREFRLAGPRASGLLAYLRNVRR